MKIAKQLIKEFEIPVELIMDKSYNIEIKTMNEKSIKSCKKQKQSMKKRSDLKGKCLTIEDFLLTFPNYNELFQGNLSKLFPKTPSESDNLIYKTCITFQEIHLSDIFESKDTDETLNILTKDFIKMLNYKNPLQQIKLEDNRNILLLSSLFFDFESRVSLLFKK